METTKLITIESLESNHDRAISAYQTKNGLDPLIDHVKQQVEGFIADVSNEKGRKECAAMAFKVAKSRTAIEKIGDDVARRLKELPKLVDAERKRVKEALLQLQNEVRQPLTDWELAENARKSGLEAVVTGIKDAVISLIASADVAAIENYKIAIQAMNSDMQEYSEEFKHVKEMAVLELENAGLKLKKEAEEAAELAALRAERDARIERERIAQIEANAAEKARQDAENEKASEILKLQLAAEKAKRAEAEAIQREADFAAKVESDKKQALERAEREKNAAIEAEKARVQDEKAEQERQSAAIEAQKKAQQASVDHRKKINNAALSDLVAFGMDELQAKKLLALIASNGVRNVTLNY